MKKLQLRKLVLEILREGRSDYYPGVETPGLTPDVFNTILKNVALGKKYSDEDKYVGDPKKGHDLMNKVSQETIDAVINGTYKSKQESMNEGEDKLYSREEAIDYIKNNPPAKYYKIGIDQGTLQQATSIDGASNILTKSPISQFKLSKYGDVIQFSAPYDEKYGNLVGDFAKKGLR